MPSIENDFERRLEYAKAFYSRSCKAESAAEEASFAEASIMFAFSFFEGALFHILEHFKESAHFDVFERSILNEQSVRISLGQPVLADQKFQSIEDRVQFMFWKFTGQPFDKSREWWPSFAESVKKRNSLMHPKDSVSIVKDDARRVLDALTAAYGDLVQTVFKRPWPKAKRGLTSKFQV